MTSLTPTRLLVALDTNPDFAAEWQDTDIAPAIEVRDATRPDLLVRLHVGTNVHVNDFSYYAPLTAEPIWVEVFDVTDDDYTPITSSFVQPTVGQITVFIEALPPGATDTTYPTTTATTTATAMDAVFGSDEGQPANPTIPTPASTPTKESAVNTTTAPVYTVIGVHPDDPADPWAATFTSLDRLHEYVVNVENEIGGEDGLRWVFQSFDEDFTKIDTTAPMSRMWEIQPENTFSGTRYSVTETVINPRFDD